ncbi:copper chaperone for superoxide dismutase [Wyeomyia smithii]|uniref:copper chaperone for superoxide dismutase n=1 Tax=Wyeomyia smithii TaxID=174621 RepID=UPI00246814F4|nr:copper chaperone for superoxide dismutase [Wyeomyia smithii]
MMRKTKMDKKTDIKIEFAVQISSHQCVEKVHEALADVGKVHIDPKKGSVLVETALPWIEIQRRIEATGRRAVLSGFGGQSAVSIVNYGNNDSKICGVVRFCTLIDTGTVVDGIIDGLDANKSYKLNVHECGDMSKGCASVGEIYNCNDIQSDENGRATIRFYKEELAVEDLIGRSVVIAKECNNDRLACGIIARSAGIFENYKKICACDGVTLWDERDRPLAGNNRRTEEQKSVLEKTGR